MVILVRAVRTIEPKKQSRVIYELCGKAFPLGVDIAVLREYASSLITGNLSALEIRIVNGIHIDELIPGIQDEINLKKEEGSI